MHLQKFMDLTDIFIQNNGKERVILPERLLFYEMSLLSDNTEEL